MRRLLGRKAVTIIAAIMSFTAIPATGIVATASPALASVHICNVAGIHGCIGSDGLNNGDRIVLVASSGGRDINKVDQHFTCCGGNEVYQLQFAAAPSQCVGVASTGYLTLRSCSGGNTNGTNWARMPVSGGFAWYSNPWDEYLTSLNNQGQQLFVAANPWNYFNDYWRWNT